MGATVCLLRGVCLIDVSPNVRNRCLGNVIAVRFDVPAWKITDVAPGARAVPNVHAQMTGHCLRYRFGIAVIRVILAATHFTPSDTCRDAQSCGRVRHH